MKWEYIVCSTPLGYLENNLNSLGIEGWELVALYKAETLIFKRPIVEQEPNSPHKP